MIVGRFPELLEQEWEHRCKCLRPNAQRRQGDTNEDTLQRLKANGDDLTCPRNIEFTVVFPDESAAERFAGHFRALGYEVSVDCTEAAEERPWDVVVVKNITPSADEIAKFERTLEAVATPLSGHNDGWCCLSTRL